MGGHLQHAFNWKMVSVRYVYPDPIFIQKQTVIYVCARVDVFLCSWKEHGKIPGNC